MSEERKNSGKIAEQENRELGLKCKYADDDTDDAYFRLGQTLYAATKKMYANPANTKKVSSGTIEETKKDNSQKPLATSSENQVGAVTIHTASETKFSAPSTLKTLPDVITTLGSAFSSLLTDRGLTSLLELSRSVNEKLKSWANKSWLGKLVNMGSSSGSIKSDEVGKIYRNWFGVLKLTNRKLNLAEGRKAKLELKHDQGDDEVRTEIKWDSSKFMLAMQERKKSANDISEKYAPDMTEPTGNHFEKIRNNLISKMKDIISEELKNDPNFLISGDSQHHHFNAPSVLKSLEDHPADSDEGFIAIIKALKYLDRGSNYFLLKLDDYPHEYAKLILHRALNNADALKSMICNYKELKLFVMQFPHQVDFVLRQHLLVNPKVFLNVFLGSDTDKYNITLYDFTNLFSPDYKNMVVEHLLKNDECFLKLVCHPRGGFVKFQEQFPTRIDEARRKFFSPSFQEYVKNNRIPSSDAWDRAIYPDACNEFQWVSSLDNQDKQNLASVPFINSSNQIFEEKNSSTLVFSIQSDDHHDNNCVYHNLYDLVDSYNPWGCKKTLTQREDGILTVSFTKGPNDNWQAMEKAKKGLMNLIVAESKRFYPPLFPSNEKTKELDIQTWEQELRIQFSDPDLRLIRVPGSCGGVRLLVVNPEMAKKITSHLSESVFKRTEFNRSHRYSSVKGYKVDAHQMDIPQLALEKFKKALDKLASGNNKKESKQTPPVSYLTSMQNTLSRAMSDIPFTIKTMLPDGHASRVLFELPKKEADSFGHVMGQEIPGLSRIGECTFSVPLEQLNVAVFNPQRCQKVILHEIAKMQTDLCRWSAIPGLSSSPPIQTIEVDSEDSSIFRIIYTDGSKIPIDYSALCSRYESMEKRYSAMSANNNGSSSSSVVAGNNLSAPGSVGFLPAPTPRDSSSATGNSPAILETKTTL